jgi:pimeloyl-ACP methyl ester carboxylesterase
MACWPAINLPKVGIWEKCKMQEVGDDRPLFLLIHGAWHGAWCYGPLQVALTRMGALSCPLELPGHGIDARISSAEEIAENSVSGAAEIDWSAGIDGLANVIADMRATHGGPLILVGHSAGGAALSALGERSPEQIDRLVYLCAFMLPPSLSMLEASMRPENDGSIPPLLLRGLPEVVKAHRIDPRAPDPAYRDLMQQAFYGDLSDAQATAAMWHVIPDEPIPPDYIFTSADRWGSIPRSYIVAERDNAIRPSLQRHFIAVADAAFPQQSTHVVAIDSDHSPFFSATQQLAEILIDMGRMTVRN